MNSSIRLKDEGWRMKGYISSSYIYNRQTSDEQRANNGRTTDELWTNNGRTIDKQQMNNGRTMVEQWTNKGRTDNVTFRALLCPSGYTNYIYGGKIFIIQLLSNYGCSYTYHCRVCYLYKYLSYKINREITPESILQLFWVYKLFLFRSKGVTGLHVYSSSA